MGAVEFADWEQLTIPTLSPGGYSFVSSGSIRLPDAYLGQPNVRVAFKYKCNAQEDKGTVWEVKNLTVR